MKYQNKERVCGHIDCNILAFELYEPYFFEKLKGAFKTIPRGAVQFKKLTGCKSYNEYMSKNKDKYKRVHHLRDGDIISYTDTHCIYIAFGGRVFGVTSIKNKQIFRAYSANYLKSENQQIYRRI